MDKKRYGDDSVFDDSGCILSPLNDDYAYWKSEQTSLSDPLSDDHCKYDNE